jgi:hypothetical protein
VLLLLPGAGITIMAPHLLFFLNVFSRQTNGTNKRPITPTSEEKKRIEQVIVRVQNGRNQSESP